jgi:hypothetical protein
MNACFWPDVVGYELINFLGQPKNRSTKRWIGVLEGQKT